MQIGDYVHVQTNNFRNSGVYAWGLGRIVSISDCGDGLFISLEHCSKAAWVGHRVDFEANDCEIVCPYCHYKYCECDERDLEDSSYLNDRYNQPLC